MTRTCTTELTLDLTTPADDEDENSRGLGIVSQIASRWGVEPHPVGKRVCAELPRGSARCA